jgi:hypothetical protein
VNQLVEPLIIVLLVGAVSVRGFAQQDVPHQAAVANTKVHQSARLSPVGLENKEAGQSSSPRPAGRQLTFGTKSLTGARDASPTRTAAATGSSSLASGSTFEGRCETTCDWNRAA